MPIEGEHIVIEPFMVSDLHLRGSELIAYAVIYSHCKRCGCYDKPISYLSEWLGSHRTNTRISLQNLNKKGLVVCDKRVGNSDRYCIPTHSENTTPTHSENTTPTHSENTTPTHSENTTPCPLPHTPSYKSKSKSKRKETRDKSVSRTQAHETLGTHDFFSVEKTFFLCGLYRPMEEADKFILHYDSIGWVDKDGKPINSVISRAKVWFAQDNAKGVYPSSRLMAREAKQECSRIIKELYQQRNQYDLQRTFVEGLYQIIETTNDTIKLIAGEAFVQKIETDSIFRNAVGRGREILIRNLEKELKQRKDE